MHYTFPGFAEALRLDEVGRLALSELILQSLPDWGQGLEQLVIAKQGGQWNHLHVTSPLKHFLQSTSWLAIRDAKGLSWARPSDRWHVPADAMAGRARHFVHLKALPSTMAKRLDVHGELANALRGLGMPYFDLHEETASPRLLEALTASVGSGTMLQTRMYFWGSSVMRGTVSDQWRASRH